LPSKRRDIFLYHVHNDAKVNKFGFIYKKDKLSSRTNKNNSYPIYVDEWPLDPNALYLFT